MINLSSPYTHEYRSVNWWRLIAGMGVTLVLGLSVHAVILQILHVAVPSQGIKSWLPFRLVSDITMAGGLIVFFKLVSNSALHIKRPRITLIAFLAVCGLNETLRGWAMNTYCTGPLASSAFFLGLMTVANSLYYGLAFLIVVIASPKVRTFAHYVLASVITGIVLAFLAPLLTGKIQSFFGSVFETLAPQRGWCTLPYGANVLIPAYLSFIEPVISTVVCAALTWRFLKGSTILKLMQFTLLILALKKQLFAAFLYVVYARTDFWLAFASMGQFTLEAAALGILSALTWVWSTGAIPTQPLNDH
ncbi:hypothetical protein [Ochrobactrum sp. CGA5]|uniref:hypothetical protein n=1 Tax=Ochrobactrum sp. CGA5 TaxID=2583453 RepID=UPI00112130D1|nr:hypothetical protein [Ochrobactrum sp. CGA5]